MKKNIIYILVLIVLAGLVYVLGNKDDKKSFSPDIYTDFAIPDTSVVHKVFIGNNVTEETILVERMPNGKWLLNNEHIAREDRIETLLSTISRAELLGMVTKSELKPVAKKMAANNKKVMIFGANNELLKTWYISHAIQSQQGTYALLELPGKGKSSLPAILTLSGFRGYLGSRFATDIYEWKSTEVFKYPSLNLKEIEVFRPKELHNSFKIKIEDYINRKFSLENNEGTPIPFNPELLAEYITGYKAIYLESFRHNMTPHEQDSLRLLQPDYEISVIDGKNNSKSVKFYYRPASDDHWESGYSKDPEKLAGIFQDEIVSFQVFNMGRLLVEPKDFILQGN